MHFPALVSPGASKCTPLPWVSVNHKGWSKSENGKSAMGLAQRENPLIDWRAQVCCHMEATPRTCLRSCPLLVTSSACWSPTWCWSCSPTAHPPVRVSPRMAPLLLLSEELDHAGSLSLVCGLRSVWSQKPLGFRPWSPWVSSGRCSLSLTFEASERIYSPLPERHWSKFSRLLHLLSSKSSFPHWKDPLLLLYWRSRKNKCFQIIHNLCDFNKSKNKHLEHDRSITVTIYHYLREDKPNALEALWTFRLLRKSATQSKMFENVFFLNHAFPKWIWTHWGLEQVQWTWWTTTREEEKQLLYVTPSLPEWCNVS